MRVAAGLACVSAVVWSGAAVAQQAAQPAAEAQLPEVTVTQKKAAAPAKKAAAKKQTAPSKTQTIALAPPPVAEPPPSDEEIAAQAAAAALQEWKTNGNPRPSQTIGNLPPAYAGGQVAVGTRLGILGNRSIFETPFSVVGVTEQKLANDQATSVRDAFVDDPSVLTVHSRVGGRDDLSIRGFSVFPTQILYDALPGLTDEYTIPTTGVERVELFKGPSALLNGISLFGGVGGTVNIVPKRAPAAGITELTTRYVSDKHFGGEIDVGRRYGVSKEFGVRVNASYEDGELYRERTEPRLGVVALGLDYQGERVRWTGDVVYQDTEQDCAGPYINLAPGVPVPRPPDPRVNQCASWERFNNSNLAMFSRLEIDLSEHWTAFVAGGIRDYYQDVVFSSPTILDDDGTLSSGFTGFSGAHRTGYAVQGGLRGDFSTGPVGHNITLAYSQVQRDTENAFVPEITSYISNLYNPVDPAPPPGLSSFSSLSFDELDNAIWTGFILADTLSILDDRILLTIGGRSQRIRSRNDQSGDSYDDSEVTPAVGIVVKPFAPLSLYASYIEGLTEGPVAPLDAANPGEIFPTSVTEQYEFGTKLDFGTVAATLAYFDITRPFEVTDPVTSVFSVNGDQTNSGVEFTLFGEPLAALRTIGGVTYTKSELSGTAGGVFDGNEASGVPNWRFVGALEWDTPFVENLTLTGRVIHVSDAKVDQNNIFEAPAWTRVDVGARYVIERSDASDITLRGTVENVLDEAYWLSTSGGLTVGPARTYLLSAEFDF